MHHHQDDGDEGEDKDDGGDDRNNHNDCLLLFPVSGILSLARESGGKRIEEGKHFSPQTPSQGRRHRKEGVN